MQGGGDRAAGGDAQDKSGLQVWLEKLRIPEAKAGEYAQRFEDRVRPSSSL